MTCNPKQTPRQILRNVIIKLPLCRDHLVTFSILKLFWFMLQSCPNLSIWRKYKPATHYFSFNLNLNSGVVVPLSRLYYWLRKNGWKLEVSESFSKSNWHYISWFRHQNWFELIFGSVGVGDQNEFSVWRIQKDKEWVSLVFLLFYLMSLMVCTLYKIINKTNQTGWQTKQHVYHSPVPIRQEWTREMQVLSSWIMGKRHFKFACFRFMRPCFRYFKWQITVMPQMKMKHIVETLVISVKTCSGII